MRERERKKADSAVSSSTDSLRRFSIINREVKRSSSRDATSLSSIYTKFQATLVSLLNVTINLLKHRKREGHWTHLLKKMIGRRRRRGRRWLVCVVRRWHNSFFFSVSCWPHNSLIKSLDPVMSWPLTSMMLTVDDLKAWTCVDFWHVQYKSCSICCQVWTHSVKSETHLTHHPEKREKPSGRIRPEVVCRCSREQITTSDWCRLILGDGCDERLDDVKEEEFERRDACEWQWDDQGGCAGDRETETWRRKPTSSSSFSSCLKSIMGLI